VWNKFAVLITEEALSELKAEWRIRAISPEAKVQLDVLRIPCAPLILLNSGDEMIPGVSLRLHDLCDMPVHLRASRDAREER
jgi:hypothetical protein